MRVILVPISATNEFFEALSQPIGVLLPKYLKKHLTPFLEESARLCEKFKTQFLELSMFNYEMTVVEMTSLDELLEENNDLIKEHADALTKLEAWEAIAIDLPDDVAEKLTELLDERIECPQVHVGANSFHYSFLPKHTDQLYESAPIPASLLEGDE